jgi:hypothetical protein
MTKSRLSRGRQPLKHTLSSISHVKTDASAVDSMRQPLTSPPKEGLAGRSGPVHGGSERRGRSRATKRGFADFQNRVPRSSQLRRKGIRRDTTGWIRERKMMPLDLKNQVTAPSNQPEMQSVEQDLFALNAFAPDLLEHVPAMFEETVRQSLTYMLGSKESKGVLAWFRGSELVSRQWVFARLVSVYGDRASPLQKMIDRVFGIRIHELVQQLP